MHCSIYLFTLTIFYWHSPAFLCPWIRFRLCLFLRGLDDIQCDLHSMFLALSTISHDFLHAGFAMPICELSLVLYALSVSSRPCGDGLPLTSHHCNPPGNRPLGNFKVAEI